jgi:hypothetical protein
LSKTSPARSRLAPKGNRMTAAPHIPSENIKSLRVLFPAACGVYYGGLF